MSDRIQLDQVEPFVSSLIRTLTVETGTTEGKSGGAALFPGGVRYAFVRITTGDVNIELALSSSAISPPTNGGVNNGVIVDGHRKEVVHPGGGHP